MLRKVAQEITREAQSERERAVAIHDFVRDTIRYGFTPRFDEATPSETLQAGMGHCNPQTRLFVELLRAAGIEAKYHFVTISGEILRGVQPNVPERISHGFAEVRVEGTWHQVDSYNVDPAHAAGAAARLFREGRTVGYGYHLAGTVFWDGASSAFSQLAHPSMILEDHGTWERAVDFYRSPGFKHRLGPLSYSALLSAMPSLMFRLWNGLVEGNLGQMRQAGQKEAWANMARYAAQTASPSPVYKT